MSSGNPYISFFPYLELNRVIAFGPWEIGPLEEFADRWEGERYKELALRFVESFVDLHGHPVKASLLSRVGVPLDGTPPSHAEFIALQRALNFCVLNHNPHLDDPGAGLFSCTSDNSELLVWTFDLEGGYVSFFHEGAITMVAGGHMIGQDGPISLPVEVHLPGGPASLYEEELAAYYDVALRKDPLSRRVGVAIDWLAQAWRNSSAIRPQDRIVLLRTGFEALLGDNQVPAGEALRALFADRLTDARSGPAPAASSLLWTPEQDTQVMTYRGASVTPIEHFFRTFGDTRNTIIHEGITPDLGYVHGTAYDGPLFNTGERLLRDAIRVMLTDLGHPRMWQDAGPRRLVEYVASFLTERQERIDASEQSEPDDPT